MAASANSTVDPDWRFAIAYNAALQCAALALKASGYDIPKGAGAHVRTIDSLRLTTQADQPTIDTLQAFRARRGGGVYETTGIASDAEIDQVRTLATSLRKQVTDWLRKTHPNLLSPAKPPQRQNRKRP